MEKTETIETEKDILEVNKKIAEENREIFESYGIRAFDVMGSVGAGKTSLIEKLVGRLKGKYSIAVINGDLTTTIDADIIGKHNVRVVQINTGRECHLEAHMIKKALEKIDLKKTNLLFIENVGNLICPSDFRLGTEKRVVVISVTEGQYVVVKHPLTFLDADIVVINKIDLAEVMGVNLDKLEDEIKNINPNIKTVRTNCRNGTGIEDLIRLLNL
ncbi:hydrogenase accessory protein HypB [Candidatus Bathyarchaeota archaeon]|nr:MAG: hydrogenase accessory protein HypB [Candidatus Bathyarchaeota archaeon]